MLASIINDLFARDRGMSPTEGSETPKPQLCVPPTGMSRVSLYPQNASPALAERSKSRNRVPFEIFIYDKTCHSAMVDSLKAVRKDIIIALKRAQRHINNQDSKSLKILSEHTIHNASMFQDQDSLSVAVIIYAISKLLERWGFESEYADEARNLLGSAQFSLEQDNIDEYRDKMKKVFEFASSVDKEFRIYIDHVIEKAQVKKGSSIYEHGISAARSAELLGVGQWELLSYIGKTRIHDSVERFAEVGQRIKFARSLFAR
jgi:hypothetical protein